MAACMCTSGAGARQRMNGPPPISHAARTRLASQGHKCFHEITGRPGGPAARCAGEGAQFPLTGALGQMQLQACQALAWPAGHHGNHATAAML
jgi:hypothetical protein